PQPEVHAVVRAAERIEQCAHAGGRSGDGLGGAHRAHRDARPRFAREPASSTIVMELPRSLNSTWSIKLRIRKIPRPHGRARLPGSVGSQTACGSNPRPSSVTRTVTSLGLTFASTRTRFAG